MRHAFPDLAPLAQPQPSPLRASVLLTAVCAHCNHVILIDLKASGPPTITHRDGCQHPSTPIAAITWPSDRPLPREAD